MVAVDMLALLVGNIDRFSLSLKNGQSSVLSLRPVHVHSRNLEMSTYVWRKTIKYRTKKPTKTSHHNILGKF